MGIIKLVTNGDSTVQFRALSLGHAVTIGFGLLSIIIAQQTWLWAGAHERAEIVEQVKEDIAEDQRLHDASDEGRFKEVDRRLSIVEEKMDDAQKQINVNTGIIGTMKR